MLLVATAIRAFSLADDAKGGKATDSGKGVAPPKSSEVLTSSARERLKFTRRSFIVRAESDAVPPTVIVSLFCTFESNTTGLLMFRGRTVDGEFEYLPKRESRENEWSIRKLVAS